MSSNKMDDETLLKLLRRAYVVSGRAVPITEAEVSIAEDNVLLEELPVALRDPFACFERTRPRFASIESAIMDDLGASEELMARAAREGSAIPTDVEARMREDRIRAEEDDEPNGR